MKKQIQLLFLIVMLTQSFGFSQNPQNCGTSIITNGTFENGYMPESRGQLNYSTGWSPATGDPDLFDSDLTCIPACNNPGDLNCMDAPCNHYGFEHTRNGGKRYIGLWSAVHFNSTLSLDADPARTNPQYFSDRSEFVLVEAAQIKLKNQITPCKTYELTFYVSSAEKGEIDEMFTADCGSFQVKLGKTQQNQLLYQPTTQGKVIYSGQTCQKEGWEKFTVTFTPDQQYDYLIIESDLRSTYSKLVSSTRGGDHYTGYALSLLNNSSIFGELYNRNIFIDPDHINSKEGYWANSYIFVDDVELKAMDCETNPPIVDAGSNKTICEGTSTTLGGSPTGSDDCTTDLSYLWTDNQGNTVSTLPNPTVSPNITTTYSVQVTNNLSGSSASDNVTISVIGNSFSEQPPLEMCTGGSVIIQHPEIQQLTNYSFNWTNLNPPFDSYSVKNPTVSTSINTTYRLTATHIPSGCQAFVNQKVNVYDPATVQIEGEDKICDNESIFLVAKAQNGRPGYYYTWSTGGTNISNDAAIEIAPSATTTYTLTVTDQTGCNVTTSKTVRVMTADAGGPFLVCQSGQVTLGGNPTSSGGTAPVTYEWKDTDGNFVSNLPNPTVNVNQSTKYHLIATDGDGCQVFSTSHVKVSGPLVVNIANRFGCVNRTMGIAYNVDVNNGIGPYTFDWSESPSANLLDNPNLRYPNATYTSIGQEVFILKTTDAAGCITRDTITNNVGACNGTVNNEPGDPDDMTVNTFSDNLCWSPTNNLIGPLTNPQGSGSYKYEWYDEPEISNRFLRRPSVNNLIYPKTFTLKISDLNNPDILWIYSYEVGPHKIKVDAGRDYEICEGDQVTIGESPVAFDGYDPVTFNWSNPGFVSNQETPVASPNQSATYTVTATDRYGCSDSDKMRVNVYQNPLVSLGSDQTFCDGIPVSGVVIGSNTAVIGGSGNYDLEWVPSDWINPSDLQSMEATTFPEATIAYTLIVKDHNNGNRTCVAKDEVTINVGAMQKADAGDEQTVCLGEPITIGANDQKFGLTYSWSPATGLSNANSPTTTANPTITTIYTLTISGQACTSTDEVLVIVNPLPIAEAGPTAYMCENDLKRIGGQPTASFGASPYSYEWSPGGMASNSTSANPFVSPPKDETFFVTVTDNNGCSATDSVDVWVTPRPDYIFNGGFESGLTPKLPGDIEKAENWSKATGLPDYYDYKASCQLNCNPFSLEICFGVPCNHWGGQVHHDSKPGHYAGLLSAIGNNTMDMVIKSPGVKALGDFNPPTVATGFATEAIETKLKTNLIVGDTYKICLKAANAKGGLIFGKSIPELYQQKATVKVKMSQYSQDWANLIPFSPVQAPTVKTYTIQQSGVWDEYCFDYTATDSFRYLIIENGLPEYDPSHTASKVAATIVQLNTANIINQASNLPNQIQDPKVFSYVFIDDVSVLPECKIDSNAIVIRDTVERCVVPCDGTGVQVGGGATDNIIGNRSSKGVTDFSACPGDEYVYLEDGFDENGNPVTKEIRVIPVPAPVADAGPDLYLCPDECGVIGGIPAGASNSGQLIYEWSPKGGLSDPYSENPTVCTDVDRVYYLEVTDLETGCKAIDEVIIRMDKGKEFVRNGGLEDGVEPETIGQVDAAKHWFLATGDPDLFDLDLECIKWCTPQKLEPFCIDIPCNFAGNQPLRNQGTDRYAGLMAIKYLVPPSDVLNSFDFDGVELSPIDFDFLNGHGKIVKLLQNFQPALDVINDQIRLLNQTNLNNYNKEVEIQAVEAMSTKLSAPMNVNENYKISLFASLAHLNLISSETWNDLTSLGDFKLVVKLSTRPQNHDLYDPTNAKVVHTQAITNMEDWEEINFNYRADSAYNYIIIESSLEPSNDILNGRVSLSTQGTALEGYVYLDDISVLQECGIARYFKNGLNEEDDLMNFKVYPNPASENITLFNIPKEKMEVATVKIFDLHGKLVLSRQINLQNSGRALEIKNLVSGTYMLNIEYNDTDVEVHRFIKI
ncbi:MAG: hypothetical protein ACJATA_000744 [Sphingobacteriales bacterium]|jgi:hypothetical protein